VVLCSYGLLGAVKDLGEVESKLAPDGGASGHSQEGLLRKR
jgi:hypothetical protein